MAKYRKLPVVIEAWQWNGISDEGMVLLDKLQALGAPVIITDIQSDDLKTEATGLCVNTLEGMMAVPEGNWIIQGVNKEWYSCDPDVFQKTYTTADTMAVGSRVRRKDTKQEGIVVEAHSTHYRVYWTNWAIPCPVTDMPFGALELVDN